LNETSDAKDSSISDPSKQDDVLSTQRSLPSGNTLDESKSTRQRMLEIESAPSSTEATSSSLSRFYLKLAPPHVTYALIALNVLAFIIMIGYGFREYNTWSGPEDMRVLVDLGAKVNNLIVNGEIWRLLSATFLHIGAIHLLMNLYALYAFGPMVEGYFGHARFLAIYIIAGLLGSIASFAFSQAVSAGASGAVFGLAGAIIVYFLRYRNNFGSRGRAILQNMLMVIGINLVFGLSMRGIDNWGHMGGLVGGAIAAFGLLPKYTQLTARQMLPQGEPQQLPEEERTVFNIGWVLACAALLWILFQSASRITPLFL